MAEELKEASDIRKLIGKNKGEEDPILVAQRFLNIFRQLHIFDTTRREEFNKQLLELAPEPKAMLNILPGGSVMQEYLDELELNAGIEPGIRMTSSPEAMAANNLGKSPLAQAKAMAQATPNVGMPAGEAKLVADASFAQILAQAVNNVLQSQNTEKKVEMQALIAAIRESKGGEGGSAQIVPDEKFGRALAQAFAQALQYSDANKKVEIKELINAVKESRNIEFPESLKNPAPAQIVANEAFARTLASALSDALQRSAVNKNDEFKELIAAVREIKTVEFPENFSLGGGGSAPANVSLSIDDNFAQGLAQSLAQALEKSESSRNNKLKELVGAIRENQSGEVLKNLSVDPKSISLTSRVVADDGFAKTLARSIAEAMEVNESKRAMGFKEIAEAIKSSKNLDIEAFSDALLSGIRPLLENKTTGSSQVTSNENFKLSADENFATIISDAVSKTMDISEKSRQEQTEKLVNGFQELLRNQNPQDGALNVLGGNSDEKFERVTQEFVAAINQVTAAHRLEAQEIAKTIKTTQDELVTLLGKSSIGNGSKTDNAAPLDEIVKSVAEVQASIFGEMSKKQTSEFGEIIALALKESQKSSIETIVEALKALRSNLSEESSEDSDGEGDDDDEEVSAFSSFVETKKKKKKKKKKSTASIIDLESELESLPVSHFSLSPTELSNPFAKHPNLDSQPQKDLKQKKSNIKNYIKNEFEPQRIEENVASSSDWGFAENEMAEDLSEDQDWEWEYEETENPEYSADGVEGQDWEWEYEDDPEGAEYVAAESTANDEDWEWEYEEESQEQSLSENDTEDNVVIEPEAEQDIVGESEMAPWPDADKFGSIDDPLGAPLIEEDFEQTMAEDINLADEETAETNAPVVLSGKDLLKSLEVEAAKQKDISLENEPVDDDEASETEDIMDNNHLGIEAKIGLQAEIAIVELRNGGETSDPYLTNNNIGV